MISSDASMSTSRNWSQASPRDYDVHKLMYYEVFDDPESAIVREKRLKRWKRDWKIELVEGSNPNWDDLYSELT